MADSPNNEDDLQAASAMRIIGLITRYICASLKSAEQEELDKWVTEDDKNMLLFEELTDKTVLLEGMNWMDATDTRRSLRKIKQQVQFAGKFRSVRLFNRWWHYAAAASFVLIAGTAGYFIYNNNPGKPSPSISQAKDQDLPPGGEKAILKLADGKTIVLDAAADGVVATQGNGHVIKQGGTIQYDTDGDKAPAQETLYNTLSTPRGGTYSLALSDGTRIWLNAASSVTFPAMFSNEQRKLSITGEVYFEVVKNSRRPFKVAVNGAEIEVLGTDFNVNGYTGEDGLRATLLEGSIKLTNGDKITYLKPGQEAWAHRAGMTEILNNVDTQQVIAWKSGLFHFVNADIPTLMREISRWYDVDVSYEGRIPSILTTGKAPRDISLANLLKILSLSGVHYKIENKKLTILP